MTPAALAELRENARTYTMVLSGPVKELLAAYDAKTGMSATEREAFLAMRGALRFILAFYGDEASGRRAMELAEAIKVPE